MRDEPKELKREIRVAEQRECEFESLHLLSYSGYYVQHQTIGEVDLGELLGDLREHLVLSAELDCRFDRAPRPQARRPSCCRVRLHMSLSLFAAQACACAQADDCRLDRFR